MTTRFEIPSAWHCLCMLLCSAAPLWMTGCYDEESDEAAPPSATESIPARPMSPVLVSFGLAPSPTGVMQCLVNVGLAEKEAEGAERVPVIIEAYVNSPFDKLDQVLDELEDSLKQMKKSKDDAIVALAFDLNVPCSVMFDVFAHSTAKGFRKDFAIPTSHGKLEVSGSTGPSIHGVLIFSSEPAQEEAEVLEVRLASDAEGMLTAIQLNGEDLGAGNEALEKLHAMMMTVASGTDGASSSEAVCVIKPDPALAFGHLAEAVSACSGTMDPKTHEFQPYIDQIHVVSP